MIIRSRVGTARANEKWFRDNVVELHIVPPKPTRYPIYRIEFYLNGASFIGRSTCYFARIVLASGLQLSGHVALRHPQSNENGRYQRGEALTENKALSAYFQGRNQVEVALWLAPPFAVRSAPVCSIGCADPALWANQRAGRNHWRVETLSGFFQVR